MHLKTSPETSFGNITHSARCKVPSSSGKENKASKRKKGNLVRTIHENSSGKSTSSSLFRKCRLLSVSNLQVYSALELEDVGQKETRLLFFPVARCRALIVFTYTALHFA